MGSVRSMAAVFIVILVTPFTKNSFHISDLLSLPRSVLLMVKRYQDIVSCDAWHSLRSDHWNIMWLNSMKQCVMTVGLSTGFDCCGSENCFRRRIWQCKWSGYSSSKAVLIVAYTRLHLLLTLPLGAPHQLLNIDKQSWEATARRYIYAISSWQENLSCWKTWDCNCDTKLDY